MKHERITSGLAALVLLAGCAASPPPRHFTLSEGLAGAIPQGLTPSIVITQTTIPELIDRPQIVIRRSESRVTVDEQHRWAEPLRREIPRVLAKELGSQLNSSRVLSLPIDGQGFDADYRLLIDVQRLEGVEGEGAQADILWRLLPREGKPIIGRSVLREASISNDVEAQVIAQRRALKTVAVEIAKQLRVAMGNKP